MTIKELQKDKERVLGQLQEAQNVAIQSNPTVNFLRGVLAYIEDNIKKLEGAKEKKNVG